VVHRGVGTRDRLDIDFRFTERIAVGELASERGCYRIAVSRADAGDHVLYGLFHTFARKVGIGCNGFALQWLCNDTVPACPVMSTSPGGQPPEQDMSDQLDSRLSGPGANQSARRRAGVILAVVAVAALVVTAGCSKSSAKPDGNAPPASGAAADLSTPESAARAVVDVVKRRDGNALVELFCVAHDACVKKYHEGLTPELVELQKKQIRTDLSQYSVLVDAQFTGAPELLQPGKMAVPYRTPTMPDGELGDVILVEMDGKWLVHGVS
jgi:hypothetical protein